MFEDRKARKKMQLQYEEALSQGLSALGTDVRKDTENVLFGTERIVAECPAIITGPSGVESGDHKLESWGWLVLTTKRLSFRRLDGDRVRVAFTEDLNFDSSTGPFDNYNWHDRATIRNISFGFLKDETTRDELARLANN
jgi:hypothetical protein